MKKLLCLSALMILFICGCSDDPVEPASAVSPALTSIKGKIKDWSLGSGYKLLLRDPLYHLESGQFYASSEISPDGKFSLQNIPSPQFPGMRERFLWEWGGMPLSVSSSTLVCSDSSAHIRYASLDVIKDSCGKQLWKGSIIRLNSGMDPSFIMKMNTYTFQTRLVYVDRDVSLKGKIAAVMYYDFGKAQMALSYDQTYKKGWNISVSYFCYINLDEKRLGNYNFRILKITDRENVPGEWYFTN